MRVLITNTSLVRYTGSELYVRDVAKELLKRGITPIVYSPRLGALAEEIHFKTIPVIDNLDALTTAPDLIHGQHHLETMAALTKFPGVPAVFFCHGLLPWEEVPPHHPRILKYVVLSEVLRDSLICKHGISIDHVIMSRNFVDMEKFRPRPPLPAVPKRALIFSNQATEGNYVALVRDACAQHGISLDIVGLAYGNPTPQPEKILGDYDIVFARGRAALESLAMGIAVISLDHEGLGAMITTQNLDWMASNNFGLRTLNRPLVQELISEEILCYNPPDAAQVSKIIRSTASLTSAVDQIVQIYDTTLDTWVKTNHTNTALLEGEAVARYLRWLSQSVPYQLLSEIHDLRTRLDSLTGEYNAFQEQVRRTQNEIDNMRNRVTWRVYQRLTKITLIRSFYLAFKRFVRTFRFNNRGAA